MYIVGKYCLANGPFGKVFVLEATALRKGSYYVADMLYVADGHLREGSSGCIYTPFGISVLIMKQNVRSLACANKGSSAVLIYCLYVLIHLPSRVNDINGDELSW